MKLTSYGAAEEVTGSCHLIEVGQRRVLLDCGLIQGRRKDELRNFDPFPFDPASLDAVVLSHAHIDHSGRLPILLRQGFKGRIHTHEVSADLVAILLKDSAYLNARDVERRNRRRERAGKPLLQPLYGDEDVEKTIQSLQPIRFDEPRNITDGVSIRLLDAGHILGSAMVELTLTEGSDTRVLAFSGDLGHRGAPILKDFALLKKADFVLMESTYGDREHRDWADTLAEVESVAGTLSRGDGNILIPAFSVGRSQMILYAMAQNHAAWKLDRYSIFLDSPMAIKACEAYSKHTRLYDEQATDYFATNGPLLSMPNFRFSRTADESRAINAMPKGALVVAGSGMCTGGRILHHLKHNLWREDAHVIIAGYQAHGSLGRRLVEGADKVKVFGKEIRVRATIHTIGGLSAHADQQGLMDWYASFDDRPPALLVHGEEDKMEVLATRMRNELGARVRPAKRGKSTDLLALDQFAAR